MYSVGDWRKRNLKMMDPRQYSFDNYYTDASQKMEMKHSFSEELINNLHLLQDPLKKNLADTIVTNEDNNKKTKHKPDKNFLNMIVEPEIPMENTGNRSDFRPMPSFAGISSFFSGVLNVITGAVSQWRPKSPAQYYDCFDDTNVGNQGSPPVWQPSKDEDQNKSVWADQSSDAELYLDNMDKDCKVAIANCENKLNKVRMLLDTKPKPLTLRSRRPRKVFVEPGLIEESYEDAFSPEDFVSVSNSTYVEYSTQCQYQKPELIQTASPETHIKTSPVIETTEIVKTLPVVVQNNIDSESSNVSPDNTVNIKLEKPLDKINTDSTIDKAVVSTCEDKVSKLKALLQERRKKNTKSLPSTDSAPEPVVQNDRTNQPSKMVPIEQPKDKRFKNPCRTTDKRKKSKLRKSIQDDLLFAQEIISSAENSPSTLSINRLSAPCPIKHSSPSDVQSADYFDEVSGRFNSSYTDSEDSFQIVFKDSPKPARKRQPSDCDSEDSFIVFEDSPDSCYTSNDVFGDEDSDEETDTECSDSESELSDSGCVPIAKMSHTMSRTIGDLTDDSLYDEQAIDEVDCAVRTGEEIQSEDLEVSEKVCDEVKSTGLLIDAAKKLQRKNQPPKKVHFSSDPPKVHVMRVWTFAARQARAGHWERCAIDRERFKRRIADVDMAVSWVLKPQHRSRVMFQRFMPWWNAQKRKELAEKKAREAEELVRKEEEKKLEEERVAKEEEDKRIEEERIRKEEDKRIEEEKLKIESVSKVTLNKTDGIKNGEEQKQLKSTKICNGNLLNGKINTKNNLNQKNKFEIKCKSVIGNNKLNKNDSDIKNKQIIPINDKIDVKLGIGPENLSAT